MRLTPFCIVTACVLAVGASCANLAGASQVGVWQFNNNLSNDLPGGAAMSALGGWALTYDSSQMIGGSPATVLSFPAFNTTQALDMPNEAGPNGGSATTTNTWSIVMDVRFPAAGNYTSLWNAQTLDGTSDGDYFVRDTEGIGIASNYDGMYTPSNWTRIAVTINNPLNGGGYKLKGYIDGVWVGDEDTTGITPDGKEAIAAFLHLFNDGDGDFETSAGYVNSVAYYDEVLSDSAIASLGGASAAGIPAVPEPASLVLFGGALGLLVLVRGRRPGC